MATNTPTMIGLEQLLTIEELSEYVNVPIRTLYNWRLSGKGPEHDANLHVVVQERRCTPQALFHSQMIASYFGPHFSVRSANAALGAVALATV